MLCGNCKKNQATKTYKQTRQGKTETSYYCLDCYHKLFVYVEDTFGEERTACPYCGTTAAEIKKRKLVGCAYCYKTMQATVLPMVERMQGVQAHQGKAPYETESERIIRRRNELRSLAQKYKEEKDYEGVRACETALTQLQDEEKETYAWQQPPLLSKP